MSTQTTPTAEAPTTPEPTKPKKTRKSFTVNLRGTQEGAQLRLTLKHKKDGSAVTYAVHSTKEGNKRKNVRGATEVHATVEDARAAHEKLIAQALKLGWTRKAGGGFKAKPDSFDARSLPAAGKASKK